MRVLGEVLGAAAWPRRCTVPAGSLTRLAVGAVDLRVEEEVGREALGRRRVDVALLVADDERGGGGLRRSRRGRGR